MAFWKKDKKTNERKKKTVPILSPSEKSRSSDREPSIESEQNRRSSTSQPNQNDLGEIGKTPKVLPKEYGVLRGFYVSEKSSLLNSFNQYVFKVFDNTTKNEIKKQVEKSFDVKVRGVKIINLPRKKRTLGRHSGFKGGFKKAVVVLEKRYSIEQAKI